MIFRPTADDVIFTNNILIQKTGGKFGIRELNLLESAINSPFQTFSRKELYPTIEEKAARLAFALAMNHSFIDGNKRTASAIFLAFLKQNKIIFTVSNSEIANTFVDLGSKKISFDQFLTWVLNNAQR